MIKLDKKNFLLILVTAILTVFLTIAGFSLFGQTPNFGSTVLDGHYIVEVPDGFEAPTLSIEGDEIVINWNGASMPGTIDKATKTITIIDKDKKDRATYKMIAGKLVVTPEKGEAITFVKQSAETKEATSNSKNKTDTANDKVKSQESKDESIEDSSSTNKDLTVDIVKDRAKETIGLIPEQAYDLLKDLEYYEYEDSEVSISIDFEDESGEYISHIDDNYKVTKLLNVVKTSDDYITVRFIVEPK